MATCKKCGSENVSVERHPYGFRRCLDCGYKWRNVSQTPRVITTCNDDRRNAMCLCCVCGKIHKCTPSFDFYTTKDHGEGILCEKCFSEYAGHVMNAEKWIDGLNGQVPV